MQVRRTPKTYDVCIIGSGAAGGTAAKVLTEGGLNVAMLEAGRPWIPREITRSTSGPTNCRIAARASEAVSARVSEMNSSRPTAPGRSKASPTSPLPARSSAGSARASLAAAPITGDASRCAIAPVDFKVRSHDGMGDDWPITYEDVAPYYDKVESYIGVFGTKENIPSAPDGVFLPPPKPRCTETIIKKACDKLNILCIPSRLAILTKPLNGRAACHYCAQCGRGCITRFELQFQPGHDSARARRPAASR